jgi:hypothetical protein
MKEIENAQSLLKILRDYIAGYNKSQQEVGKEQVVEDKTTLRSEKEETSRQTITPSPFDNLDLSQGDNTLVPIALKNLFDTLAKQFYNLGKQKGRLGNDDSLTIEALAHSEASLFHERVKAEVQGKVEALEIDAEFDEEHCKKMKQNYFLQKRYYDAFLNEKMSNPNSFSWLLAGVYLLAGCILLFADCVLTLNLIRIAFDFDVPPEEKFQLMKLGTEPTWPILKHNWQVIFTSLGIALLSLYIKIFYDEYIGVTDGNEQLRRKHIIDIVNHEKQMNQKESGEKDVIEQNLQKEINFKFRVRLIILLSTIILLGLLAALRYYAEIEQAKIIDSNAQSVFELHPITGLAIFMLTLLFPIVAGICFSLTLKVKQNTNGYTESDASLKEAKKMFDHSFEKHLQSQKRMLHAKATLDNWIKNIDFLTNTKQYMISHYKTGYSIDYVNADQDAALITDIVERMTQFRNKVAARKHYTHLNNL